MICLNMEPHNVEVASKPYQTEYVAPFKVHESSLRHDWEHLVSLLWIRAWLGTYGLIAQHQSSLRQSQVSTSQIRYDLQLSRRGSRHIRKHLYEKALNFCDLVALLMAFSTVWLRTTLISRFFFSSFSRLLEAARRTNEFVKRTIRSTVMIKPMRKKRHLIAAVDKGKIAKGFNSKKFPYSKKETSVFTLFRHFLVE